MWLLGKWMCPRDEQTVTLFSVAMLDVVALQMEFTNTFLWSVVTDLVNAYFSSIGQTEKLGVI